MNPAWKKKLGWLGGIVIILAALTYTLWGGLEENMVYFVTPTELLAKGNDAIGKPVRLGGVVVPGTMVNTGSDLTFELNDEKNNIVRVHTTKTPPQMFQESMGAVVEGRFNSNMIFEADRLMVKHGNEYRPPEEGEMPKEIYKELYPSPKN